MSTYDVNAPNANQSPSLFPAQAVGNFTRLKDIINAEHNFADSSVSNQGCHKQVTFINRTGNPVFVSGTNAILYTKFDANSESQLFYYNGVLRQQMTPYDQLLPIRIQGEVTLASGASQVVYPNPGFDYCGIGHVIFNSSIYNFYNLIKYQGSVSTLIQGAGTARPTFEYVNAGPADLEIENGTYSGPDRLIKYSLIINRITF